MSVQSKDINRQIFQEQITELHTANLNALFSARTAAHTRDSQVEDAQQTSHQNYVVVIDAETQLNCLFGV